MTRASVVRRFLLLAAWTLGAASCGDFVGDDASEFADANMDATADAPAAVDTDVHVPDALVDAQANETPDNAVDAPGQDADVLGAEFGPTEHPRFSIIQTFG